MDIRKYTAILAGVFLFYTSCSDPQIPRRIHYDGYVDVPAKSEDDDQEIERCRVKFFTTEYENGKTGSHMIIDKSDGAYFYSDSENEDFILDTIVIKYADGKQEVILGTKAEFQHDFDIALEEMIKIVTGPFRPKRQTK